MQVFTIGHGTRPAEELVECLHGAAARTLVDVRRYPSSRRNPQFDGAALAQTLGEAGILYRHAVELGGRRSREPGEERFACIRTAGFRSYAARMGTDVWQEALDAALSEPDPCLMCAETHWTRCHRRLISELLVARGHEVWHSARARETRAASPVGRRRGPRWQPLSLRRSRRMSDRAPEREQPDRPFRLLV